MTLQSVFELKYITFQCDFAKCFFLSWLCKVFSTQKRGVFHHDWMIFTSWWFEFVKHVLGSSIYSRFLPKRKGSHKPVQNSDCFTKQKIHGKNNKKHKRGAKTIPWQVDLGVNWACTTAEPFLRVLEDERFPFFGWDFSRWNLVMKVHPWDMYLCVCIPWTLLYAYNLIHIQICIHINIYIYMCVYMFLFALYNNITLTLYLLIELN